MTTTILGANGKLGRILACFAHEAAQEWRTQTRSGPSDVIWSGDFEDLIADQIFHEGATIINMIGYAGPDEALLYKTNVRFVEQLLAKAAETGVSHVILASSAAIYGAGTNVPFIENATPNPVTPYGASKLAMEQVAAASFSMNESPAITIARIGNVAGADALMAAARRHIEANTAMPLHFFEDGSTPVRSYVGPYDLYLAIRALISAHHGPPQTFNVAHPHPVSLDNVLRAYRRHVMPGLDWVDAPATKGTPRSVTLATEKLQKIVTYEKNIDPSDALGRQTFEYLSK